MSGLALVGHEDHVTFFAIYPLLVSHVIGKVLIGVEPYCATFAFYVDTIVGIEISFADFLLTLTAPLVVVSTIVCEHVYVVNNVIVTLFNMPKNVDDCRLINLCFGFVNETNTAWRFR